MADKLKSLKIILEAENFRGLFNLKKKKLIFDQSNWWIVQSIVLIKKVLFSHVNNVALEVFNFEKLNFSKTTVAHEIFSDFSAFKTKKISTDWKCRLHLGKKLT